MGHFYFSVVFQSKFKETLWIKMFCFIKVSAASAVIKNHLFVLYPGCCWTRVKNWTLLRRHGFASPEPFLDRFRSAVGFYVHHELSDLTFLVAVWTSVTRTAAPHQSRDLFLLLAAGPQPVPEQNPDVNSGLLPLEGLKVKYCLYYQVWFELN